MKNRVPTEHQEQVEFVKWAKRNGLPIFAIPNGGKRGKITAAKLKLEGVRPGIPDLFIALARGGWHGLFVEMKRIKGGSLSKHQKMWIQILTERNYKVVVGKGAVSAITQTKEYLNEQI